MYKSMFSINTADVLCVEKHEKNEIRVESGV